MSLQKINLNSGNSFLSVINNEGRFFNVLASEGELKLTFYNREQRLILSTVARAGFRFDDVETFARVEIESTNEQPQLVEVYVSKTRMRYDAPTKGSNTNQSFMIEHYGDSQQVLPFELSRVAVTLFSSEPFYYGGAGCTVENGIPVAANTPTRIEGAGELHIAIAKAAEYAPTVDLTKYVVTSDSDGAMAHQDIAHGVGLGASGATFSPPAIYAYVGGVAVQVGTASSTNGFLAIRALSAQQFAALESTKLRYYTLSSGLTANVSFPAGYASGGSALCEYNGGVLLALRRTADNQYFLAHHTTMGGFLIYSGAFSAAINAVTLSADGDLYVVAGNSIYSAQLNGSDVAAVVEIQSGLSGALTKAYFQMSDDLVLCVAGNNSYTIKRSDNAVVLHSNKPRAVALEGSRLWGITAKTIKKSIDYGVSWHDVINVDIDSITNQFENKIAIIDGKMHLFAGYLSGAYTVIDMQREQVNTKQTIRALKESV